MSTGKSWEIHKAECEAVAAEGITITGFVAPWISAAKTRLIATCCIHGEWQSTTIAAFKAGVGCPSCHRQQYKISAPKDWDAHKKDCEASAQPGVSVLGFVPPFKGVLTKVIAHCDLHGEFNNTDIRRFKKSGSCPSCNRIGKGDSWEVLKASCEALAKPGISVLEMIPPFNGVFTRIKCNCAIHGDWSTTNIKRFLSGSDCPTCARESAGNKRAYDDQVFVKAFIETGAFLPGVVFTKSTNQRGYWSYTCPKCSTDDYVLQGLCSGIFRGQTHNLKSGTLSCRCSDLYKYTSQQWDYRIKKECLNLGYRFLDWESDKVKATTRFSYECPKHGMQTTIAKTILAGHRCPQCQGHNQQQAYITIIGDKDGFFDLKFGIARDSTRRLKQQSKAASLRLLTEAIYDFPTVEACKSAERAVKQRLADYVGSVPAVLMPDGYSETLPIGFMDDVKAIYLEFGGVLKKPSLKRPKRVRRKTKRSNVLLTA